MMDSIGRPVVPASLEEVEEIRRHAQSIASEEICLDLRELPWADDCLKLIALIDQLRPGGCKGAWDSDSIIRYLGDGKTPFITSDNTESQSDIPASLALGDIELISRPDGSMVVIIAAGRRGPARFMELQPSDAAQLLVWLSNHMKMIAKKSPSRPEENVAGAATPI